MSYQSIHETELSIFENAPTDTSLQSREWIEFRPVNQIAEGVALELNIAAQSAAYMDLKRSLLNVKLRLTQSDNTPIAKPMVLGLVNLPLHTIFRQIDVAFQQTPLGHSGHSYPCTAYIDTLLNSNADQQYSSSQLFIKDTADHDETDAVAGLNKGLHYRSKFTNEGKIVDLEEPLLLDHFQQPRLIVNGVSVNLKLWPSNDAFAIMSHSTSPGEKVQILDACFKLCVQKLNPAVIMAHKDLFKNSPDLYPYLRSEIKSASIATGQYSFSADDTFQGLVPNHLIVGLVSSSGYMGDYKKSPFKFQTYDCSSLALYVDGQSLPAKPLQPNYAEGNYIDCYKILNVFRDDLNVNRDDYVKGYCLYVMDLNPYSSFNTKRKGYCRLEIKFAKALPESVTIIMYATFPEVLYIDHSRCVFIQ